MPPPNTAADAAIARLGMLGIALMTGGGTLMHHGPPHALAPFSPPTPPTPAQLTAPEPAAVSVLFAAREAASRAAWRGCVANSTAASSHQRRQRSAFRAAGAVAVVGWAAAASKSVQAEVAAGAKATAAGEALLAANARAAAANQRAAAAEADPCTFPATAAGPATTKRSCR